MPKKRGQRGFRFPLPYSMSESHSIIKLCIMNFVDLDVLATLAVASSSDVNISPSGESQRVKEFPMHRLRSLEYT